MNHDGERLDFHSLRNTCGAWAAMTGEHPNAVKAVMRHSTITLTMDTYGHLFPGQEADTVARLPGMLPGKTEALKATGTMDRGANERQQYRQQPQHETMRVNATDCNTDEDQGDTDADRKSLSIKKKRDSMRRDARPCTKAAFRTRTGDLRFTKPLLYQLS